MRTSFYASLNFTEWDDGFNLPVGFGIELGKGFSVRPMYDGDRSHLLLNYFATHFGVSLMVDKVDVSYPIFSDAKQNPAWHMFKVKVLPTLFLVDENGQIVAQWTGEIDHKQVKDEIAGRMAHQEETKNQ